MPSVFDFRPGRSIRGANPQLIGQELERLRAEKGTLRPEDVLEAAADPASPLHVAFSWDDSEAAQKWRLTEARKLIVSVRVLNSPAGRPTTAFVSVRTPEAGRQYMPVSEALSDEELRVRVLAEARQAIEALERRYAHLADLGDVFDRLKRAAG
jgi:hypothetical protein